VPQDLDTLIDQIEAQLSALGTALQTRDALALETAAQTLQRALAASAQRFAAAAREAGGVPLPLRRRLARIDAQIHAQRDQLARAGASLDRALAVLAPRDAVGYAAQGRIDHLARGPAVGA
jgi:hypothetical protein